MLNALWSLALSPSSMEKDLKRPLFTTKTLLIMKLTAIILLSACLGASAKGHSQQITLQEKNAPIQKVFEKIQNQSGFIFWYEDKLLQKAKPVDIAVQNASLEHTLQLLFKDQPLAYEIIGKTIAIKEKGHAVTLDEI